MHAEGYGVFMVDKRRILAHRFSYQHYVGPIPPGMDVDHRCRNRACVNPSHLRTATRSQNLQNHSGPRKDNTSGVRGVTWDKANSKWRGQVYHQGKAHRTPRFVRLEDAEQAVLDLRRRLHTHNELDRT